MKVYAGIGSRRINKEEWNLCYALGAWLAKRGWLLRTGAAQGTDQAFAEGALSVGGRVILCLPWASYESSWVTWAMSQGAEGRTLKDSDKRAFESVDRFHPAAHKLTKGPRALHARNWLIVAGVRFVLAWPKPNQYGNLGGTAQGMRIAKEKGIEVINLNDPKDLERVVSKLEENNQ